MANYLNGIDVSHWNGTVDWAQVAQSGVQYAFAKATDGTQTTDSQFAANWVGMKSAGLLRGASAFYEMSQDPQAQAENFCKTVTLESGDLPPVVDIETGTLASHAQMAQSLRAFIDAVKAHYGLDPIIYTSPGYWNAYFNDSFADCPLWVAEYGVSAPKPVTGWGYWTFWQHSQSGRVPGVNGDVDLDYFNGSMDQLKAFLKP